MDTGASSHVTGQSGNLSICHSPSLHHSSGIVVGNGQRLPKVAAGSTTISPHNFHLHDILVTPSIVQNLIGIRKFTTDNWCSVEFDPFGFGVKDLATKRLLHRSNSPGPLYPFYGDTASTSTALSLTMDGDLWHKRLGHPGRAALSKLSHDFLHLCNNSGVAVCSTCQLGRQPRLPFPSSKKCTSAPFQIIHCDLWTSPVASFSGYQYYLIVLADFTHYSWSFPLRCKSDTSPPSNASFSMSSLNSMWSSSASNATMAANLSTPPYAHTSPTMVSRFVCHAPTPLHKTAKLSDLSVRPTMLCVPSSFKQTSLPPFGLRPSTPPHTS